MLKHKLYQTGSTLGLLLLLLLYSTSARAEILYSDSFSGPDYIRPSGWVVIEEPLKETLYWRRLEGQYNTGNGDNIPSPDGFSFSVLKQPGAESWGDYETAVSFWMPQFNGGVMLVGRWKDRNNHYEAILIVGEGQRVIKIDKVVNGQRQSLGRAVHGLNNVRIPEVERGTSTKNSHLFVLTMKGNRLDVRLNDVTYLSVTDDTFSIGNTGVGVWFNEVYFDNFLVTSLTDAAAAGVAATSARPGGAPGAKVVYRLALERKVDLARANLLKQRLDQSGVEEIEIVENGADFDVLAGIYLTEDEANRRMNVLANQGVMAQAVVAVDAKGAIRLPGEKRQTYKILMKIYDDRESAEHLKSTLESDAYFPVNISRAMGKFQVTVGDFEARADAEKLADKLRVDGYIVAQIFESDVLEEGFVVGPAGGAADLAGGGQGEIFPTRLIPQAILDSPEWKRLDREKQREIRDIIANEVKLQTQEIVSTELTDIRKRLDSLDDNQKKIVQDIRAQFQQRDEIQRDQKQRLQNSFARADELIDGGKYAEARTLLNQLRAEYPTDAQIDLKLRRLHFMEKGITFEGEGDVRKMMENQMQITMTGIWNEAEQLEKNEQYASAIAKIQTFKNLLTPDNLDDLKKAEKYITELSRKNNEYLQRIERERRGLSSQYQSERRLLLVGFAVLALVIAVLAVLMIVSWIKRGRERSEIRATIQSLTMKPMMDLEDAEGRQLAGGAVNQLPPSAPALAQHTPSNEDQYPQTFESTAVIDPLGGVGHEESLDQMDDEALFGYSDQQPAGRESEDEVSDSVVFDEQDSEVTHVEGGEQQAAGQRDEDLSYAMESGYNPPEPAEAEQEPSLNFGAEPESINLSLEDTLQPSMQGEETVIEMSNGDEISLDLDAPAASSAAAPGRGALKRPVEESMDLEMEDTVAGSASGAHGAFGEYDTEGEHQPQEREPRVAVSAAAGSSANNTIYQQDFDQEDVGNQPLNWHGEYDYALLEVTNEDSYNGAGNCLKFSKPVGDGRAYCYCSFPDTSGKVQIQFDIKCNDKNKYLLGFYIERDQDFKNSIHTVIHRTETQSTPMLRVHGVPVPYAMGEWRRIRYDINLVSGTVNGYVNGQLVASNIKLDTNPEFINTLAIRDNNPTTGELLLDNITIKKL